jgi:predicted nucleic acid-binding protein
MLVISDTSPLTALLLTHRETLLRQIFGRVVIPPAVQGELQRVHTVLPAWIEIIAPQTIPASITEAGLDPGETEAIALALELHPDAVLMDERLGRRLATRHGLVVTGLLGFLVLAKQRKLITDIVPVIQELQAQGNCWFSHELLSDVCRSVGEAWV